MGGIRRCRRVVALAVLVLLAAPAGAVVLPSDAVRTLRDDGSVVPSGFGEVGEVRGTFNASPDFWRVTSRFDPAALGSVEVISFDLVLQVSVFSNTDLDLAVNAYDPVASGLAGAAAYADAGDGALLATVDLPASGASPLFLPDRIATFGAGSLAVGLLNQAIAGGTPFGLGFASAGAENGGVWLNRITPDTSPLVLRLTLAPEPGALALLGVGLLALVLWHTLRRRAATAVDSPPPA